MANGGNGRLCVHCTMYTMRWRVRSILNISCDDSFVSDARSMLGTAARIREMLCNILMALQPVTFHANIRDETAEIPKEHNRLTDRRVGFFSRFTGMRTAIVHVVHCVGAGSRRHGGKHIFDSVKHQKPSTQVWLGNFGT